MGPWEGEFLKDGNEPEILQPASDWREFVTTGSWPDLQGAYGCSPEMTISDEARRHLNHIRRPLGLSLRSVHSCLRVAGTMARLDRCMAVGKSHVIEALEFRLENLALDVMP